MGSAMTTVYVSIAVFEYQVSNGTVLEVLSGAYTINTSVSAGGLELVDSHALGSGTVVSDGGRRPYSAPNAAGPFCPATCWSKVGAM
jgi:autotransporter passenger strand-loop-strand repeat protein